MPFFNPPFCEKCGKPVITVVPECRECKGKTIHIKNLLSLGRYDGSLKQLIISLKYSNAFKAADYLGERLAGVLQQYNWENDHIISFVPIKRTKQAFRGYNQAELIAVSVAGIIGLPFCRTLVKSKSTKDQSGLPREQRKKNLRNVFTCINSGKVKDRSIILIDDVYTSGSTMNEAAKTLIRSGASEVIGLTAARTLNN